jgi:glycosyltransferase involved in cell wall biosynthesis
LIDRLDLGDCVHFLGPQADVPRDPAAVDLSVLPSWNEPFGTVAAESLAMGTPVLVTAVGGVPEYVSDDVTGLVLPPRRPDVWADAVLGLLADPPRLELMGARGPAAVAGFTDERYAAAMLAIYERSVERRHVPGAGHRRPRHACTPASITGACRFGATRCACCSSSTRASSAAVSARCSSCSVSSRRRPTCGWPCPFGPLAHEARTLGVDVSRLTRASCPSSSTSARRRARYAHSPSPQPRRGVRSRAFRPDIVHANSIRAGLACALALPSGRIPLVIHCRDVLPHDLAGMAVRDSRRAPRHTRRRRLRARGRAVGRPELEGTGRARRRQRGEPAALRSASIDPAKVRAELGIDGGPVLAVIGQLTSWKRQDHAVRVLDRLRRRHQGAQLLIVGEAKFVSAATRLDNLAYERELHELVTRSGLQSCVRFLGEREDPERVLAITDVLLSPSSEEPFGRTIIEALAMGVPIVATDRAGPAEILRGRDEGRLVAAEDIDTGSLPPISSARAHGVPTVARSRPDGSTPEAHARAMRAVYEEGDRARAPATPRTRSVHELSRRSGGSRVGGSACEVA